MTRFAVPLEPACSAAVLPGSASRPFHRELSLLKEERGYSFRQLAYRTGLSAGYLNHLSKGTRSVPAPETIERIARALHVEPTCFAEYRLSRLITALAASPALVSALYDTLCGSKDGELPRLVLYLKRRAEEASRRESESQRSVA